MGLRYRVFLPLFALGAIVCAYVLLVWYPTTINDDRQKFIQTTNEHLSSLAKTLLVPTLDLDFSRIYAVLDDVQAENKSWLEIRLLTNEQEQLYPLDPSSVPGEEFHVIRRPIRYLDEVAGELVLTVDVDSELEQQIDAVRGLVLVVLGVVVVFVLATGVVTEFVVRRPLARLSEASDRLSQGDFGAPLPGAGRDEVGRLVASFTSMRESIKRYQKQLRHEVDERATAVKIQQGRARVLERLATKTPLLGVLELLAVSVEEVDPATRCSILLVDESGTRLRNAAGPSLPDFFTREIDGLEIRPAAGGFGAAVYTQKRMVVEDIMEHPSWAAYREIAQRAGLRACWSEPITSSTGEPLGIFAIYYGTPHSPTNAQLQSITTAAQVAGIAIEHAHTEQALREQTESLELLQRIALAANEAPDIDEVLQVCLDEICRLTGWPLAHAYVATDDGMALEPTNIWHGGKLNKFRRLRSVVQGKRIASGEDLPGRVLASAKREWIGDVSRDADAYRIPDAESLGIRSAFAFPILLRSKVEAVIEFFLDTEVAPPVALVLALDLIGSQIGRILERKRAQSALRVSEYRFRALYDENPSMFFTIGSDKRILSVNNFAAKQLGWAVDEIVGEDWSILHREQDQQLLWGHLQTCLAEPNRVHRWEIRKVCRDETVIWVRESIRVIDAGHGRFELLSVCENVTEAHRLSEKLAYQATHDALTELVNRAEFENRLFRVLATARKKNSHNALCFLDLDKFKIVNDTCGHAAGDSLLHQIAKVLQDRVRTRDTVARLGGDEFGVLMESCSLDNARRGANELRRAVEDFQFFWEGQVFNVGVSIGMVPVTQSSGDTAAVLNAADNACYMAKEQGRNRIYIDLENKDDPDLRSRAGERIAAINRNLEQNGFQLWSQPILTLGGSSTGVREFTTRYEIFVRMRDEQGGLTLPIAFLPAAERYSLAPKIDRWVVGATVDWLKRHPRHLSRLTMCSINLSGSTLAEENFPSFVIKQLVAAKIPAEKICFEISDASVIRNLPNAIQLVKALRSHGCLLAIDDFSGLSSIDYLKTLPVDFIKIGRIIVKDVVDDPIDRAMVKAVNDISHAMGKQTIATCVESEKTLLKLREIGVDYVQGIHLGKPAPLNVPNEFQVVKSA